MEKIKLTNPINHFNIKISLLLYILFLCSILVDIGGGFGLKYLISLLISFCSLVYVCTCKVAFPFTFLIVEIPLFFLAPLFYLFLAVNVFSVPLNNALSEISPFLTWILYPVLVNIGEKNKIIRVFKIVMLVGSVIVLAFFLAIFFIQYTEYYDLINKINVFANHYRLGYLGLNPLGGKSPVFFPNVYFRWSLLLIPTTLLMLQENKTRFLLPIFAVFLTTSTAVILLASVGMIWVFIESILRQYEHYKLFRKRIMLFLFVLLGVIVALYFGGYRSVLDFVVGKFSITSQSTWVKLEHIKSVINTLSEDSFRLFFGMGIGSVFYSTGVGGVVANIEVDHFNLIRQYGLIYATAFFLYVFFLFLALWVSNDENGRLIAMGLLLLFLAAGTNPLLISPVFFLYLILARVYTILIIKERKALILNRLSEVSTS